MTNVDLIDWTLQEAQQLRNKEDGHKEVSPSLSKLLSVLEGEPLGSDISEPTAQVISFPPQPAAADHPTAGEPVALKENYAHDFPIAAAVEEPALEKPPTAEKPDQHF